MIAWAQCRPDGSGGWKLAPGWETITGDNKSPDEAREDCEKWWTTPAAFNDEHGSAFDDADSAFDFSGTDVIRRDAGESSQAQDFLLTLQGRTGFGVTTSLAMVYSYVFSSLIMMVVFGIIALGIIIAKVAAIVMMIAVFFAMLLSLWPGGGKGSLGKYLGQYVGMSLFVFGMQLIFAFLTLLTSMMVQAGAEMFGDGSLISMIWTGFAPVISVALIHMVFTKFLKLPSPFSMTGAQQWGSAAAGGAVGGAIGAGVMSRMNRMRMRSEYALMRSGERAGARALGVVSGGRFGRRGRGAGRGGMLVGAGAAGASAAGSAAGSQAEARSRRQRREQGAPGFLQSRIDPDLNKQRKDARDDALEAARERGQGAVVHRFGKDRVASAAREGRRDRLASVAEQMKGKPIRQKLAYAGRKAVAGHIPSAGRIAGVAAATVATGGLAPLAMAGVWAAKEVGRQHAKNTERGGMLRDRQAEAKAAAAELAEQERLKAEGQAVEPQANGESVTVPSAAPAPATPSGRPAPSAAAPVTARPSPRPSAASRAGQRPFGSR